jgi:hypothetical protein
VHYSYKPVICIDMAESKHKICCAPVSVELLRNAAFNEWGRRGRTGYSWNLEFDRE